MGEMPPENHELLFSDFIEIDRSYHIILFLLIFYHKTITSI